MKMTKRRVTLLVVLSIVLLPMFAQELKSGDIISEELNGNTQITRRKCSYNAKIGDWISKEKQRVYESYSIGQRVIGELPIGTEVTVTEICTIIDTSRPESEYGYSYGEVWYKIENTDINGWIRITGTQVSTGKDPYYHGNYQIIDVIKTTDIDWTVHAINQSISVWKVVDVHEKPGIDSVIVTKIHDFESDSGNSQQNYTVVGITEEKDTVDGKTDYWLMIEYEPGKTGWVFGRNTTVERGGPRFYVPELVIESNLNR